MFSGLALDSVDNIAIGKTVFQSSRQEGDQPQMIVDNMPG